MRIQGNSIGLGRDGVTRLDNGAEAIALLNRAASKMIGGGPFGARNVLANSARGVWLSDPGTAGNLISFSGFAGIELYDNPTIANLLQA